MKKKKTSIITVVVIFVLWSAVFTTDYIRCGNLKSPIFVIASDDIKKDGGSGIYYGLGYSVEIEKELDIESGVNVISVQMKIFDKIISASIQ